MIKNFDTLTDIELSSFAELFLFCRLKALYYDIERCLESYDATDSKYRLPPELETLDNKIGDIDKSNLKNAKVYSPALMFCFSVIDLLGSLYKGTVGKRIAHSKNARDYVKKYMYSMDTNGKEIYNEDHMALLWDDIYRNELMHLSMPQTVFQFQGVNTLWKLDEVNPKDHLQLLNSKDSIWIGRVYPISYDMIFNVDIKTLRNDVINSVFGKNKYMTDIENDPTINSNFRKAIKVIYDTKNY